MKDMLLLPGEMLKMDDDEKPYMPVWRVVINGRSHREVIERDERPTAEATTPLVALSKSMH